jgi:predicted RecB family nuclease
MQIIDGRPVYAATDLVGYLACEHLTKLERAAMAGLTTRPERIDPELDIIRRRGFEHEQRYLGDLRTQGKRIVEIALDGSIADRGEQLRAAAAATEAAMADGPDVIFQATFFDGTWRGHADFLLRVESPDRPSKWGPYHYEVADTKLARHVKASAVLQLCTYVELLERLQEVRPEWMYVALGGSAREVERLRVDDYMAYYRASRDRFLAAMTDDAAFPPVGTYPEPVDHCDVCRWAIECAGRRRADDHLSLVANISGRQRKALGDRSITTLAGLGQLALPMDPRLDGIGEAALERIREQARIQLQGRVEGRMKYELLLPAPGKPFDTERGLATLPPPSAGDMFFDIEGDPYAFEDGLDYLFGVLETDGNFHAFWSREADGTFTLDAERTAFERLIDFIMERYERDPSLHVYHYAPYEPTALKRLMGRYATRENEVDRLLRGGVLVDLLRAVRQSLRASVESYSIKKIEPLYHFEREVDLRDAGSSIVAFEEWLELADSDRPAATHLDRIERYNRDDVVSNQRLREWLESLRDEFEQETGQSVPRPAPRHDQLPADVTEAQARVNDLAAALARVPNDPLERSAEQQASWLLGQLLGWHRREDKAMWWEFFHRMLEMPPEELVDDAEPIGGPEPLSPIGDAVDGRQVWRYQFPEQDFGVSRGTVYDPGQARARPDDSPFTWEIGDVQTVDPARGTIDIKRRIEDPHPLGIVPLDWFRTIEQQAALIEIGQWVLDHGIDAAGPHRAARDLLLRRPPRIGQIDGAALIEPGESDLDAARRICVALDDTVLAIQGPPGSGKTWTGARMICALLRAGRRVGITANSHKVIGNLLVDVLKAADEMPRTDVRVVQRGEKDNILPNDRVVRGKDNPAVRAILDAGTANLAAGTSWLWASGRMTGAVDVLFVDEAGQMSLANVVAMSRAASSIVLLGDPQQLDQPLKGSHPPGADRSALAHVLADDATMRPDRGLFLEKTWRLHPDLTRFTSEVFYEGRLESQPDLARQRVDGKSVVAGAGPRFVPQSTAGYDNESPPEAEAVAQLVRAIVEGGSTWTDDKGRVCPVTWDDVLIVAPYNAQVGAIKRLLPSARVGTVDKFQGQQAPVSVYSMTTSAPELAPRGMEFLYSRNRLNVATSRARCVAVVVASPELLRVRARTPRQMRLANALARFVEMAPASATERPEPAAPDTRAARPMVLFPDLARRD